MSYIVGLNRDRDSYQVARALVEAGELEQLVTDYYVGVLPREIPGLGHRQTPDIPPEKVTASVRAFAAQLPYEAGRRLRPIDFPSRFVESALGATIARVARRAPDADLLLYSGSARQAFEGPSRGRRILFQYHPRPQFIEQTMVGLDALKGTRPWLQEAEVLSDDIAQVHAAEIARTEDAVCASSLTRAGLVADGLDPSTITVAPYGCPDYEIASVVDAGRVAPLQTALKAMADSYTPKRPYRDLAYEEAERLSWAGFRRGIRKAVGPGVLA